MSAQEKIFTAAVSRGEKHVFVRLRNQYINRNQKSVIDLE